MKYSLKVLKFPELLSVRLLLVEYLNMVWWKLPLVVTSTFTLTSCTTTRSVNCLWSESAEKLEYFPIFIKRY